MQEFGRIPDSVIPADGKSLGFPAAIQPQESIPIDSADVYKYCASGIVETQMKFMKLARRNGTGNKRLLTGPCGLGGLSQNFQKVGKGLQWANDNVYKPFIKPFAIPILGTFGPVGQTIGKGLDVASSFLDYGYGADKTVVQLAIAFHKSF
ncbi:MAG: hypothetical protein EZS28_042587 [Streblomastix strix]|uniref:Uncharacterized protein n=1 Tax=Streblomastix strix TaxID=222440 RepID=A0A5J4TTP2_9EUKA|nr:MAG: hypothetical protein EZS28_042587 [Streblomastix strix]